MIYLLKIDSPAPYFYCWIDMRKRAEFHLTMLLFLIETNLTYKEVTSRPSAFGFLLYKLVNYNFIIPNFLIVLLPN
jgi:hypothetical protein